MQTPFPVRRLLGTLAFSLALGQMPAFAVSLPNRPTPTKTAKPLAPMPTLAPKSGQSSPPPVVHSDDQPHAPTADRPKVVAIDFAGDLVDEDQLRRLLTVELGAPLDPATLRQTISLFYETDRYDGVTVESEPFAGGVRLTFTLRRQDIITSWRFVGNKHVDSGVLARALDLQWGQSLNPARFGGFERTIQDRYLREGFGSTLAHFTVERSNVGQVTLVATVDEGLPVKVSSVELQTAATGTPDVMGTLGVKAGDLLRREDLLAGMDKVETLLSSKGYLNGRVGYSFVLPDGTRTTNYDDMMAAKPEQIVIQMSLEPGQQALVTVEGHPLLAGRDLARAITVYKNRSYSPFELDASAEAIRKLYILAGYADAKVTHSVIRQPDGNYSIKFHVDPGTKVVIKAIKFVGNQAFDEKTLLGQFSTRPAGLTDIGAFDADTWEIDLEDLKGFYASKGYLSAKILHVERTLDADATHMTLAVNLEEGPQTLIQRLLVDGATPAQAAGILQALPVDPGAPYNPRQLPEFISTVQAYFARTGYPLAHVTGAYEKLPPVAGKIAGALRFKVAQGPLKRIGRIVLSGNVKTHDDVLRHQLTIEPGQDYDAESLFRTQQQVYELGFFDRVAVQPVRPISSRSDDPVDLEVLVHERESGWISLGGGYDGIGAKTGLDVSAEYVQNNLFGAGYPMRLEGEYGPSKLIGTVTLRDPYLFNSNFIGETGFNFQQIYRTKTFRVQSYGPSIGISRQINQTLAGSLRYSWSHVNYLEYSESDLASAGGAIERTDSIVTAGLNYDTRSDLLNPRWGSRADFTVDLATPLLYGSLIYTRPRLNVAHYFPLPGKIVLAVGGEADYIQTLAGRQLLPNDVRFLAGGADSIRGYSYNAVGVDTPNSPACVAGTDPSLCVTGGTVMALGHVEVRFPVYGDFGGVVFTDFGNVWATPGDIGIGGLRLTAGLGARYQTPIGPIRADYGFRVRPTLDFGGFYFGLGQAF